MAVKLPPDVVKLIEEKNFAHLATVLYDGSPHVAPVWVDHDGDIILVNTAIGRVKQKNILKEPHVALSIIEQNNPYNRIEIEGASHLKPAKAPTHTSINSRTSIPVPRHIRDHPQTKSE